MGKNCFIFVFTTSIKWGELFGGADADDPVRLNPSFPKDNKILRYVSEHWEVLENETKFDNFEIFLVEDTSTGLNQYKSIKLHSEDEVYLLLHKNGVPYSPENEKWKKSSHASGNNSKLYLFKEILLDNNFQTKKDKAKQIITTIFKPEHELYLKFTQGCLIPNNPNTSFAKAKEELCAISEDIKNLVTDFFNNKYSNKSKTEEYIVELCDFKSKLLEKISEI